MALPEQLETATLRFGNDPYDQRVTYLADLGAPGALGRDSFDVVVMDGRGRPVDPTVAARNFHDALSPDGLLVTSGSRALRRAIEDRFGNVTCARSGVYRVLVARKLAATARHRETGAFTLDPT